MIKKILDKKEETDAKVTKQELKHIAELKTIKDKTVSKSTTAAAPVPVAAPMTGGGNDAVKEATAALKKA